MKKLLALCIPLLFIACSPVFQDEDNHAPRTVEWRAESDCSNFCEHSDPRACLTDFSDCSELAGKKPFHVVIGGPVKAMTGQKGSNPVESVFDFCAPPVAHPYSFLFKGGLDGSSLVFPESYLGRIKHAQATLCVRPYILPEFDPFPFPQPFPYELYPAGNEMEYSIEITAANDDKLIIDFLGTGYPDCDNLDLYILEGKWWVSGGTGRFADATGGGCVSGSGWANLFDPNPQVPDLWTLDGGIDF